MKILLVVFDLDYRGTQRCVKECAMVYRPHHDVRVYAFQRGGEIAAELQAENIPVWVGKDALQRCLQFRPDIVHVHRPGDGSACYASLFKEFKDMGAKIIETSVFGFVDYTPAGQWVDLSLHISHWNLYRWNRLKSGYPYRGVYLPNIVDTARLRRSSMKEIQSYRDALHIPHDAFVVGRIGKTKWPWVNRFIYPILKQHPNTWFLSVQDDGGDDDRFAAWDAETRKRVVEIPRMNYAEVPLFYSACTITLNMSYIGESFGFVIAESMCCETPVVAVSTPDIDDAQIEVVQHGVGGFVAPSARTIGGLLDAIIRNPEKLDEVRPHSRRLIQERYSREVVGPWLNDIVGLVCTHSGQDLADALTAKGYITGIPRREIITSLRNLWRPTNPWMLLWMDIKHTGWVRRAREVLRYNFRSWSQPKTKAQSGCEN